MSFPERRVKREREIETANNAKCIHALDENAL